MNHGPAGGLESGPRGQFQRLDGLSITMSFDAWVATCCKYPEYVFMCMSDIYICVSKTCAEMHGVHMISYDCMILHVCIAAL